MFHKIIRRVRPTTTRASVLGLVISLTLLSIASISAWRYQHGVSDSGPTGAPYDQTDDVGQVQGVKDGQKTSTPNESSEAAQNDDTQTALSVQNNHGTSLGSPVRQSASSQPAAPANQPSAVTVALNINTESKGSVSLPAGSNHCDVLRQALTDGLIGNLDMRYNSQHGSYGVYVIDGIGDPNNIWWGYKVNGKSPPYGCSKKIVAAGDAVLWEYVR